MDNNKKNKALSVNHQVPDVNQYASILTGTYKHLVDKYMPLVKLSRKEKRFHKKTWISSALKVSINNKNILYDKLSKSPEDQILRNKYSQYRNLLTKLKRKAEANYYAQKFDSYGQNKSKTWQLVNEIAKRKRKSNSNLPKSMINEKGEKVEDASGVARLLNQHFGSVGQKMASKLEENSGIFTKDPLDYLQVDHTSSSENIFQLAKADVLEVVKLITGLDLKKACGYDLITNSILRNTVNVISPYFTTLFNFCIRQGVFPQIYKTAQVIPLFKGGDKESPGCYRPISLLPALGKLFEKLVSTRVLDYVDKFNILSPHQFGFRKNFGTEYAILDIYEKLLSNLDTGLNTCSIFLDLAKAFDTVSHNILLRKLDKYGILETRYYYWNPT